MADARLLAFISFAISAALWWFADSRAKAGRQDLSYHLARNALDVTIPFCCVALGFAIASWAATRWIQVDARMLATLHELEHQLRETREIAERFEIGAWLNAALLAFVLGMSLLRLPAPVAMEHPVLHRLLTTLPGLVPWLARYRRVHHFTAITLAAAVSFTFFPAAAVGTAQGVVSAQLGHAGDALADVSSEIDQSVAQQVAATILDRSIKTLPPDYVAAIVELNSQSRQPSVPAFARERADEAALLDEAIHARVAVGSVEAARNIAADLRLSAAQPKQDDTLRSRVRGAIAEAVLQPQNLHAIDALAKSIPMLGPLLDVATASLATLADERAEDMRHQLIAALATTEDATQSMQHFISGRVDSLTPHMQVSSGSIRPDNRAHLTESIQRMNESRATHDVVSPNARGDRNAPPSISEPRDPVGVLQVLKAAIEAIKRWIPWDMLQPKSEKAGDRHPRGLLEPFRGDPPPMLRR